MSTFRLPISPNYVAGWGLWEALRELYQNALDAQDADPSCSALMLYDDGMVTVTNSVGILSRKTLVLGNTTKAGEDGQRGKFGEGYKLAILVLLRMGYNVQISNGNAVWCPRIEFDEEFGSEILVIREVPAYDPRPGVRFSISVVKSDDWAAVIKNLHPITDRDEILLDPKEEGRIYVGGLYATTAPGFKYGYALKPSSIKLDRDRSMVEGYALSLVTSRLWMERSGSPEAYQLLKDRAQDVEMLEHLTAPDTAAIVSVATTGFLTEHGPGTVPCSTQDDVNRAVAAGVKWALVPAALKAVLAKTIETFIPSKATIAERLREFVNTYGWRIGHDGRRELEDIAAIAAKEGSH